MSEEDETPARPLLRVARGNPDDEELAALTAVVAGLASGGTGEQEQQAPHRSLWGDPAHRLRVPIRAGRGAWRASALPR